MNAIGPASGDASPEGVPMDVATDIRERLVRLEVEGDHRKEKLDDLTRLVGTHADESRAYRVQHDARHAAQDVVLSDIRAKLETALRRDTSAEDTGSVLVEGVEAAGAGAAAALKAVPREAWLLIGGGMLAAMGFGGAARPVIEDAMSPHEPAVAADVAPAPTADGEP